MVKKKGQNGRNVFRLGSDDIQGGAAKGLTDGDVEGLLEIREDNAKQWVKSFYDATIKALEMMGLQAERFAKQELTDSDAVDTGRLRNSVTHSIDDGEMCVYVGTNVEYGPYIELGTSRMDPRPYLVPAATEHSDTYKKIYERALSS